MIIAKIVAKDINATITHIMEPDGTWNMNIPIELKMANSMNRSDLRNHDIHWNGIMGNVFKGKYQMSLSAWFRQLDRIEIFDFCQLYQQAGTVLAWSKKQMNEKSIDMGLYIRPFEAKAWMVILAVFTINGIVMVTNSRWNVNHSSSNSYKMLEICAWLCFVIISAYYCGALTMFFAVKQDVQFKTTLDAIKLFPGNKLTTQRAK